MEMGSLALCFPDPSSPVAPHINPVPHHAQGRIRTGGGDPYHDDDGDGLERAAGWGQRRPIVGRVGRLHRGDSVGGLRQTVSDKYTV